MINKKTQSLFTRYILAAFALTLLLSCDRSPSPTLSAPNNSTPALTITDVQTLIAQAVEIAQRRGDLIDVAVTDREGNVLGAFSMTGSTGSTTSPLVGSVAKARTAAFLSSNQHGFTTLTACFITRSHFPPGITNTPGGPLFGVPFSSIAGGNVQPNNPDSVRSQAGEILVPGDQGLTGVPGGVPVFKNGLLAGGLGVSTGGIILNDFELDLCSGITSDETIALGAVIGYETPQEKRGDNILIDGIRFLYSNADVPAGNFTPNFTTTVLGTLGAIVTGFPIRATLMANFPIEGEVDLGFNSVFSFDFTIKGSLLGANFLTATDVRDVIEDAVAQADITRAAIRRPLGSAARVFVTVCDLDGTILGIWRTPDATLFSYDVSAQKARTAVAFSDPTDSLGISIRKILGVDSSAALAMTCRALGFLSQDFYPPGIDEELLGEPEESGPLFQGAEFILQENLNLSPTGNGITIFPGAVPLYKNGQLVGAVGVSGDGVDQDDIIAFMGATRFMPPEEIRCDQFFFRGLRLPFIKFPRRPEI